ncbi:MAG: ATP-binding protein [Gemmatimonadota bacterium]|nr:ATP-binding protein [Gemmatimonadota bacterium]
MESRQEQGTADLRGVPRKARETSDRFADEDLRLQNRQLLSSHDALDRERQKYFELFQFAPDAYFLTDTHGIIREANLAASQLLGVPAQFLAGKRLPNFFEEQARKAYRHQLDQLCGSERSEDWEIDVQPASGELTAVSISIRQIARRDRSIGGYRWIVRDITKRKRAELAVRELNRDLELRVASRTAQLAAANRRKDELLVSERKAREEAEMTNRVKSDFLALMSHEFRTPLQAIFGYTELLEREIHGPLNDPQRRDLLRIQQSQQLLLGLITTVLDFAKLESGQPVDLSLRPTLVHEILLHIEGLVGAQLEEKEMSYEYRCDDPSIVAHADAGKVQQIVLNLLANAIKFTAQGGSITLVSEAEPDAVAIRVSDTGRGIPADKLEAVFQPFVQIKSKGFVTNGTGLGLPISRRLATAMGGSLTATTELGRGSTFTLRLQRIHSD